MERIGRWKEVGRMEWQTNSARIAIDTLESTSVEFVLANKVIHSAILNDATAMSLHVLIRACRGPCCARDLNICQLLLDYQEG